MMQTPDFDVQLVMSRDGTFPAVSAIVAPLNSNVNLLYFDRERVLEANVEDSLFCSRSAAFNRATSRIDVDSFLSVHVLPRVDKHQCDQARGTEINARIREPIRLAFNFVQTGSVTNVSSRIKTIKNPQS